MPRVSFASLDTAPAVPSPETAAGQVETRGLFSRERDPLHLHVHRMGPGASIQFVGEPTDRVLYVWDGAVDGGGVPLRPRSSAIVEYGASLTVTAGPEGANLLDFHLRERGAER